MAGRRRFRHPDRPHLYPAALTLPTAKAGGFSVHPRRVSRESPKGLPGPLDIPRRVLVSIENQATIRADVGAHAQRLGYARPTAATVLRGIGGWHGDNPTPGACCLGFEDGPELRPARISEALSQVMVPDHVSDPQIFQGDGVVLAQEIQRGLVVEVRALSLHRLMRLGELVHGFAAPLAA